MSILTSDLFNEQIGPQMIAVIYDIYHLWSLKGRGGAGDEGLYKHLYQL